MSCYVRHLRPLLPNAGLGDDALGRKEADRRVRAALGMPDADCPDVWRALKALGAERWPARLLANQPAAMAQPAETSERG